MKNTHPDELSLLLLEACKSQKVTINNWLADKEASLPMPPYCSVDLRNSGFKVAPVDNNLFPAGFNNLCEQNFSSCADYFAQYLRNLHPNVESIAILCEAHSRNLFYFLNLSRLKTIVTMSGLDCNLYMDRANWPFSESKQQVSARVETLDGHLDIKPVGEADCIKEDVLLLNNDLSDGIPNWLSSFKKPVLPNPQSGWHARSKCAHRTHYKKLAHEFSELINLDPWILTPLCALSPEVDFSTGEGLDETAALVDSLIQSIREKYDHYGIGQDPFIFVKSDTGTYGMGIMTVYSGEELKKLNRRTRNKMSTGKGGISIQRLVLEEGVPTTNNIEGCPAEPVIYHLGGNTAGVFFRTNCKKTIRENLNSRGMDFIRYCEDSAGDNSKLTTASAVSTQVQTIAEDIPSDCRCDEKWVELYKLIGKISQLASASELKEMI